MEEGEPMLKGAPAIQSLLLAVAAAALGSCSSFTDLDDLDMLGVVDWSEPDGASAQGASRAITVEGFMGMGVCQALTARVRKEGRTVTLRMNASVPSGPCGSESVRRAYHARIGDLAPGEHRVVVVHSGGMRAVEPVFDGWVSVEP